MDTVSFCRAFLKAYDNARARHDDESWKNVWEKGWSHHMLWNDDSVLKATAASNGLMVARGEFLRLDAVFTSADPPDRWARFPIRVAVEHENFPWTFENELRVLLSTRAPLKVGITYCLEEHRRKSRDLLQWLSASIRSAFQSASEVVGEDPRTEYLFIVGEESSDLPRVVQWKSLVFTAREGANAAAFTRLRAGL